VAAPRRPPPGSSAAAATPAANLLVVDDNMDSREVLSAHLRAGGFSVREAADGAEALRLLSEGGVDLVLLVVMMPGMTGIEILRRVRVRQSPAELPVIMVTALGRSPDVVSALDAGANDYVTKPLDFPVVVARVRAQLRSRPPVTHPGPPPGEVLAPGAVLEGRYRIEGSIGAGSFGSVYRATHLELDRPVAVKVLKSGALGHESGMERFRREAVSGCRVNHPNAVAVLDYGVSALRLPFLVMELLEGRSLAAELVERPVLTVRRAVQILGPVCQALDAAHQAGIVHRDVKPANVFLHRAAWGEVPKVVDFGIAKILDDAALEQHATVEGWIVGTPAFMAPERFGQAPTDGRADVYSVGVTLFLALSGRLPFEVPRTEPLKAVAELHRNAAAPSLCAANPAVPAELEHVVVRALDKDPARRPGAAQLAADLAAFAATT
jgi:CheY-like chemotaxis protein